MTLNRNGLYEKNKNKTRPVTQVPDSLQFPNFFLLINVTNLETETAFF